MYWNKKTAFLMLLIILGFWSCKKEEFERPETDYLTENVIIVVIDGARYSDTWGDPDHKHIPGLANEMAPEGVVYTNMYNTGPTYTNAGHSAITTGKYKEIDNRGKEVPKFPSIFQMWNQKYGSDPTKSWIITSKDKLEVLKDSRKPEWAGKYMPSTNCGISGLGSGYRTDVETYNKAIQILTEYHPNLVLISFREPDYSGHRSDFNSYIKGLEKSYEFLYEIWNFIQNDDHYSGKTTLLMTNDHGRHLDGHKDGYVSHGDKCDGCRHIDFYGFGPDFKKGYINESHRDQLDIPATVAELMDFELPTGKGNVMYELFE